MQEQTDEKARKKVIALIEDLDYAVVATHTADGAIHARPMAYRSVESGGDLWFLTKLDSRKVQEIKANPKTLVSFADPKKQNFVSIMGTSEIVTGRAKVQEVWSELYRAWFPGGPEDDNVVAIRVHTEHAEYWDTPTGVMVYAYGYLKAATTGKPAKAGDVGAVSFENA